MYKVFDNVVYANILDMGIEYKFTIEIIEGKLKRLDCPNHKWYWPNEDQIKDIFNQLENLNF
jgi:hypothetical protein